MRPNIGDKVVDKLKERRDKVRAALHEQYRRTKPFRQEPVDNKELLYYYDQLSAQDIDTLIAKHGRPAVNHFVYEMETLKQRGVK